ncbi:hypothetical protein [Streptomyces sp. ME19-01-6]|uniref:hypothetical protein n=1 Tax=Streptomyces sp. ME19-01-6 TaxID=3028686 RepID=UPI0029BE76D0|nr:hypothetical protein [Streptomyces sp. ME19-01-6]MDX3226796.1 hypothetical protein [Streptomyces sp. ME19-01-6]
MRFNTPSRLSRRFLLAAGPAIGLSGLAPVSAAAKPVTPRAVRATAPRSASHLVLDYRPSQATGWPPHPGKATGTIGGHIATQDFTFNGTRYRISLLPFGQDSDAPDPVYEDVPADTAIAFEQTLADAFGDFYAFRYQGGFPGEGEFRVQSYSVTAGEPTAEQPGTSFGGGVYVVYDPDVRRGDPGIQDSIQWIQVVRSSGFDSRPSEVDNLHRANPFSMDGGLTSVNGTQVCNFHDEAVFSLDGNFSLEGEFMAEVFLAQDTGRKDTSGRGIVKIFGGLKWGWQVRPV